jgi:cell division transport system permease protein
MARRFDYYFRETVSGLRRNGLVAIAAVSTVFIAAFLFGGAWLIRQQINLVVDQQTERVEVAVYLNDNISQADFQRLNKQLHGMPEVKSVDYESKQEAYERFRKLFANQQQLVSGVSRDALPASFRVKLDDPERDFEVVAAQVAGQPGIENVVDQRQVLKRLFAVSNILQVGAFGAAFVMLASAIALIANTVRMAVFARRKEIGIMRLVGANNWFIRMPFMIEALVEGLLGIILAVFALVLLRTYFFSLISREITFLPVIRAQDVFVLVPWLLLGGTVIAIAASFLAMKRFLEV